MYYAHFGLKEPPFKITPNTEFFFSGGNRGIILEALQYAVTSGEGIIKVVGEVGSGKTMLCRMLQTQLPPEVERVYLANPSVAPEDVLHAIAFELQLNLPKDADRLQVMHALQQYLLDKHAEGRQVVIFVEEAQGMPLATLEEIRLLSNLETKHDKLLQIVLFGQPELDINLNANHIRQLRERITHSFNLGPLDQASVRDYLIFRMRAAGYFGPPLFTDRAVAKLASSAQGLVRRVNILADKALLAAYAENAYQVLPRHVSAAIQDSEFGAAQLQRSRNKNVGLAIIATLVIGLAVGMMLNRWWPIMQHPAALALPKEELAARPALTPQQAAAVTKPQTPPGLAQLNASLGGASSLPPSDASNASASTQAAPLASTTPVATPEAVATPGAAATATETNSTLVAAPPVTDILQFRLDATQQWLQQQPAATASIQLLGSGNDAQLKRQLTTLESQLQRHQLGIDQIYAFRTRVGERPFVTVLYGSYADRDQAIKAIEQLPPAIKSYQPHVRTVGSILKETNQFQ